MASNLPINQYNQNVTNSVKDIPGLSDLMKGLNVIAGTLNDVMHQLLPGVFSGDTLQTLQVKATSGLLQDNYERFKDDPLLMLIYKDSGRAELVGITKIPQSAYDDGVNKGYWVNGVGADGKAIFPNIIKGIIEKIQAQEAAKLQLQQQQIERLSEIKSTYGPFYPIVNWLRNSEVANDIKFGTIQIGQDVKNTLEKATGTQSGLSPWIIGVLVIGGALAITYVILED